MPEPTDIAAEMDRLQDETMKMIASGVMNPPKIEWWWEPRREGELTTEYLGRVLGELGLDDMAARAREGHFDDFNAPADVADGRELMRLVAELRIVARDRPDLADPIERVENGVRHGEFDATKQESDRWAASKDGQDTMRALVGPRPGRNEPCPCGSGKKFKKCCGA